MAIQMISGNNLSKGTFDLDNDLLHILISPLSLNHIKQYAEISLRIIGVFQILNDDLLHLHHSLDYFIGLFLIGIIH